MARVTKPRQVCSGTLPKGVTINTGPPFLCAVPFGASRFFFPGAGVGQRRDKVNLAAVMPWQQRPAGALIGTGVAVLRRDRSTAYEMLTGKTLAVEPGEGGLAQ